MSREREKGGKSERSGEEIRGWEEVGAAQYCRLEPSCPPLSSHTAPSSGCHPQRETSRSGRTGAWVHRARLARGRQTSSVYPRRGAQGGCSAGRRTCEEETSQQREKSDTKERRCEDGGDGRRGWWRDGKQTYSRVKERILSRRWKAGRTWWSTVNGAASSRASGPG
jgi:hypothetical protein